jgi:pimeloyl-ACP methyl ester carboxylesterase
MTPVVLVHGAYHGPCCWDPVVRHTAGAGLPTRTVELPFSSFADDVAAVRRAVEAAGTDVVVCAHSYGGLVVSVATSAAGGGGNVGHLVYVAAFMLDVRSAADAALLARVQRDQAGWDPATASFADARRRLYQDCPEDGARAAFEKLRPTPTRSFAELLDAAVAPGYEQIPSTYVVCTRDRFLPPRHQAAMAERATTRVGLDAGHAPFLSRPAELAALLATPPAP